MRRARKQEIARSRVLVDGRLVTTEPRCLHGTNNGYTIWRCRCVPCTEAFAAAKLLLRDGRYDQRVSVDGHLQSPLPGCGYVTEQGRAEFGCYCELCRSAHRTARRSTS